MNDWKRTNRRRSRLSATTHCLIVAFFMEAVGARVISPAEARLKENVGPVAGDKSLLGNVSFPGGGGNSSLGMADGNGGVENSFASGVPKQSSENPQSGGEDRQSTRSPSYPPVWVRIPVAVVLGLGANGVMAFGLITMDKRCRTGVLLCVFAILMYLTGTGLLLCLGIPATWGWPV